MEQCKCIMHNFASPKFESAKFLEITLVGHQKMSYQYNSFIRDFEQATEDTFKMMT